MHKYGVPTPAAEIVSLDEAAQRISSIELPIVLKAEGLAAGKGAVIAKDPAEAKEALNAFRSLGKAASRIILEQYLEGVEATFFALTDGTTAVPLASAQDHKRVFDADRGPNTGGMGAISPTTRITPSIEREVMSRIIHPVLEGLASEGRPYSGELYAGLMLTPAGPYVLEFNARWGDPEAQAVLPRLKTDWVDVMEATLDHRLPGLRIEWKEEVSVCVALTSEGYPGPYRKGEIISGLETIESQGVLIFHAGTERRGGKWLTRGGRVLGVTALGKDYSAARSAAYRAVGQISFPGMHFRKDIGASEI